MQAGSRTAPRPEGASAFPTPGAATGPGKTIRPIGGGGIEPTPFINPEPDVTSPPAPPAPQCPSVPSNPPIVVGAPKNTATCNW